MVSNYPTKSNKLNLSKINTLSKKFNLEIGYDHSSSGLGRPYITVQLQ